MRLNFRKFGVGLLLITLGFCLGVWITLPSHIESQAPATLAPIQNAGGSATGNALEVAKAKMHGNDTLISIAFPVPNSEASLVTRPNQDTIAYPPILSGIQSQIRKVSLDVTMIDPDGDGLGLGSPNGADPWEGRMDSISRPLTSIELSAWLRVRGISPKRIIVLSPQANSLKSKIGIEGPAFPDLSNIAGGVQAGDLIVYRQGSYTSATQLPSLHFRATPNMPITLLGWPGEHVRILTPQIVDLENAANWRIIGLEWSSTLRNSKNIQFEDCLIHQLSAENAISLNISGCLFRDTLPSITLSWSKQDLLEQASVTIFGNLIIGPSIVVKGFSGDSLSFDMSENVIVESGHGCISIDSSSVNIHHNTLFCRSKDLSLDPKNENRIEDPGLIERKHL